MKINLKKHRAEHVTLETRERPVYVIPDTRGDAEVENLLDSLTEWCIKRNGHVRSAKAKSLLQNLERWAQNKKYGVR